ncbi:MAG: Asp-tRNA(Asn)/Glu-tRNA(Gln) amidotransferase subunit GatB [Myxococcota bacterium]
MSLEDFEPVIGLEVHAQLLTSSKIFCGCSTTYGAPPNENTCPVCQGHPGVLPVLNRKVVEFAIKLGLALECTIRRENVFARKQYFYPDLPKGYQISQYDTPICSGGKLTFTVEDETKRAKGGATEAYEKTVGITRIHMEEDAGKNIHLAGVPHSLVDFNRAGVPLLEIVSEPDIRSSVEAAAYLKQLRSVVMALGICDGNMQEGSFRCDANVSVRRKGETRFGTRVELKNINSFKFVMQGIDYEIARQVSIIESGGKVVQETRGFDPEKGESRSQRSKEEAHDYRYFPDPDLLPLVVVEAWIESVRATVPELPRARAERFVHKLGLTPYDARVLNDDQDVANWYEAALGAYAGNPKSVANWTINEVMREVKEDPAGIRGFPVKPEAIGTLVRLIDEGRISGKMAKDVFAALVVEKRSDPEALVKERGWEVVRDDAALTRAVDEVLDANAKEVEKYKAGKSQVLGFLVGQVMKKLGGKADPKAVNEALRKKLS